MVAITETQIKKIARDLILSPKIIEAHPTYIKMKQDDPDHDFLAVQKEVLRLVKDGFREFDRPQDLTDESCEWVLIRFESIDLSTIIRCLERAILSANNDLIGLSLNSLFITDVRHNLLSNKTILVNLMNRLIFGSYTDNIKATAWSVLKKIDGYEVVDVKDWQAYAASPYKKD